MKFSSSVYLICAGLLLMTSSFAETNKERSQILQDGINAIKDITQTSYKNCLQSLHAAACMCITRNEDIDFLAISNKFGPYFYFRVKEEGFIKGINFFALLGVSNFKPETDVSVYEFRRIRYEACLNSVDGTIPQSWIQNFPFLK